MGLNIGSPFLNQSNLDGLFAFSTLPNIEIYLLESR